MTAGAMVEYLLHKYGPGKLTVPKGGRQHADYLQVMPFPIIWEAPSQRCLAQSILYFVHLHPIHASNTCTAVQQTR